VFDQVAFNTLLQACSKADHVSEAEEVFEEMCRVGILPSHVTTSILVKMYGKAHMLDKAIAVSERMEHEYGRKPNLFVYTCLIQACVQNKQVRRSWDMFNSMLRAGVEPDAITYGTVIHGCVYLNRFDHAMSVVRHAYKRPPKACADSISDLPFAISAMPLMHVVPLQPEVLQMLLSAVRRKEQSCLAAELEDIMAEHPHGSQPSNSGPSRRRPGGRGRRQADNL
jgi:pentatricopeptide repeat protein